MWTLDGSGVWGVDWGRGLDLDTACGCGCGCGLGLGLVWKPDVSGRDFTLFCCCCCCCCSPDWARECACEYVDVDVDCRCGLAWNPDVSGASTSTCWDCEREGTGTHSDMDVDWDVDWDWDCGWGLAWNPDVSGESISTCWDCERECELRSGRAARGGGGFFSFAWPAGGLVGAFASRGMGISCGLVGGVSGSGRGGGEREGRCDVWEEGGASRGRREGEKVWVRHSLFAFTVGGERHGELTLQHARGFGWAL